MPAVRLACEEMFWAVPLGIGAWGSRPGHNHWAGRERCQEARSAGRRRVESHGERSLRPLPCSPRISPRALAMAVRCRRGTPGWAMWTWKRTATRLPKPPAGHAWQTRGGMARSWPSANASSTRIAWKGCPCGPREPGCHTGRSCARCCRMGMCLRWIVSGPTPALGASAPVTISSCGVVPRLTLRPPGPWARPGQGRTAYDSIRSKPGWSRAARETMALTFWAPDVLGDGGTGVPSVCKGCGTRCATRPVGHAAGASRRASPHSIHASGGGLGPANTRDARRSGTLMVVSVADSGRSCGSGTNVRALVVPRRTISAGRMRSLLPRGFALSTKPMGGHAHPDEETKYQDISFGMQSSRILIRSLRCVLPLEVSHCAVVQPMRSEQHQ